MKKIFTSVVATTLLASAFTLSASAESTSTKKVHNMENKMEMKKEHQMDSSAGMMATGTENGEHASDSKMKKEEKMMKKESKMVKKEEKAVKKMKKTHKVSHKSASSTDPKMAH